MQWQVSTDGGSTWISRDVGVTGYGAAPDSGGLDSYPFESPGTKCPGALLVSPSNRNAKGAKPSVSIATSVNPWSTRHVWATSR